MSQTKPGATVEQERILAEYRRRAQAIPADRYSWASRGQQFSFGRLWADTICALDRNGLFPLEGKKVLDVGCARGTWLLEYIQWGADPRDLAGIDLIPANVDLAQQRLPVSDIRAGDASRLPWDNGSFDLISQLTVFSSVLDAGMRRAIAAELVRVLKPSGSILWYDCAINNPRNNNILGIDARAIRELFPGCEIEMTRVTLAPPIARTVARVSWGAALALETIPFLRTHLLAVIRKPAKV